MEFKRNQLVTIIIFTYNSSKFIVETLESAKAQDYPNLELIVSDDASKDDTIGICKDWLKGNSSRFSEVNILTVEYNTGISANMNRGMKAANGEWVILGAGDDVLMPGCISDNMEHVGKNKEIRALFSYCRMYRNETTEENFMGLNPSKPPVHIINNNITAAEQYKLMLLSNRIPFTPSFFAHTKTCREFGIVNEKFRLSEDYQLYLSLTKNNIKLYFMEKETVKYRVHQDAACKVDEEFIVHPIFFKAEECMKEIAYPYLPWDIRLSKKHIWVFNHLFKIKFLNKDTRFNNFLHFFFTSLINPFHYIVFIKSHYIKKYKSNTFYDQL